MKVGGRAQRRYLETMVKVQVPPGRDPARGGASVAVQPSTVLFLAANPVEVQLLQLGEECRAIEEKIREARFRDQIRFHSRWAARPDDLLHALNDDTPSVLHFSGHGAGAQGLCFQAEDGSAHHVSADGLARVMRAAGGSVMLVVLNACYSEVQAQALVEHVPCVIGMPDAIGDEAAIIYAASFYGALGFGKSVANAHQQGLAALALQPTGGPTRDVQVVEAEGAEGAEGAELSAPVPMLMSRPDIDPDHVYIVNASKHRPGGHSASQDRILPPQSLIVTTPAAESGKRQNHRILVALLAVAVATIVVGIATNWLHPERTSFGLVVRLHGLLGKFDTVCTSGTVTLDIGTDRRSEKVTSEGEARFTEIPRSFIGKSVPMNASCSGYESERSAQITLMPHEIYYVLMHEQCGDHYCSHSETPQTCPGDCPAITNDAGVEPAVGGDAAIAIEAAIGVDASVNDPSRYGGPCTRTPGGEILHKTSKDCPKLRRDEPDAKVIISDENEKGYTCTDIYRCK